MACSVINLLIFSLVVCNISIDDPTLQEPNSTHTLITYAIQALQPKQDCCLPDLIHRQFPVTNSNIEGYILNN
jgi:hypothetical protein